MTAAVSFGRRGSETGPNPRAASLSASAAERPAPGPDPVAQLRAIFLSRLDPSTISGQGSDKPAAEVERLLAEIADEMRLQLNGREQRQLAAELVDDMLCL